MWYQDDYDLDPYMLIDGVKFYADDLARLVDEHDLFARAYVPNFILIGEPYWDFSG